MKIVNRTPQETADISSAQGTAFRELWWLVLIVTLIAGVLFICIGLIVDAIVANISFETEARIFSHFAPQSKPDDAEEEKLTLVRSILNEMKQDPEVPPLHYRLIIIPRPKPNACAFPGGTIGVTQGLLDSVEEEMGLAFVIGHELGHFHNRDHLRGLGRAVGTGVVFSVLFGGEMSAGSFGGMFNFVVQRVYSRAREEAADRFGIDLVYRVYGETEGVDVLFRILEDEKEIPDWAYMFSTHPSPAERIKYLKEYAKSLSGK